MIVCSCEGLNDRSLRRVIREGCTSVSSLSCRTGAGSQCGSCLCDLEDLVTEEVEAAARQRREEAPPLAAK